MHHQRAPQGSRIASVEETGGNVWDTDEDGDDYGKWMSNESCCEHDISLVITSSSVVSIFCAT